MPDGLEYIVRPYQSPNPHSATIIPSTPGASKQRATLTWGAQAKAIIPDSPSISVVCCDEQLHEQERVSQKVRVYQNGDPNSGSWIDYERPTAMRLQKKDKTSCGEDDWEQISYAAASVSADLAAWDDFFARFDSTDQHCKASWTFTYGKKTP